VKAAHFGFLNRIGYLFRWRKIGSSARQVERTLINPRNTSGGGGRAQTTQGFDSLTLYPMQ